MATATIRMRILTSLCLFLLSAPAFGRVIVEGFLGSAYSFSTPLTVFQSGQPNISLKARYSTEPFKNAPYYVFRIGGWGDGSGWEFEHIHHKIVLDNLPAEIQSFKATFGFNFFLVSRSWDLGPLILRIGMGPIIAHPITTVRGQIFNSAEGGILGTTYFLVGFGASLGAQRRFYFGKNFFLSPEVKLTAAYANLPVVNGTSHVPNVALHGLLGAGYHF